MKQTMFICIVLISFLAASTLFAQDLISSAQLSQIGYYKYWQAQLPLQETETVREVFLVDENLYVTTTQAVLYALHADVGTIRWSAKLAGSGHRIYRPTHVRSFWGKNLALVSTTDKIHWLERTTGEPVFKLEVDFVPATAAVSDGVRVYAVGSGELDRKLTSELHCLQLTPSGNCVSAINKWRIRTKGLTTSTPVLWSAAIFYASHDGKVRACGALDKERLWVFQTGSPIKGDIFVDSTGVYLGCSDRNIYKLDVETGRALWRCRTPGEIIREPIIVGEQLYQLVQGNGILAVHTDSGEQAWHLPHVKDFITASANRIYLLSRFGDILAVDSSSGQVKAQIYAGDADLTVDNVRSEAMYLANRDGRLFCAQAKNVPYLRFEQIQAAQESADTATDRAAEDQESDSPDQRPDLKELLRSKSKVPPLSGG